MRIERIRTLAGPNVYTYRPALAMTLDLEDLDERETREFEGFNGRLLALLPGLADHHCSRGRRGGFVERLEEGTYFGHTVEHVALELAALAGCGAKHGKTRHSGEPRTYNVVIEFCAEHATRDLLRAGVALVEAVLRGEAYPLEETLASARRLIAKKELGPSTRAIVEAAERRGIPWTRVGDVSLVQLGWGARRRLIQAAVTERSSAVAVEVASDKDLTKELLRRSSVPVPEGRVVRTEQEALDALGELGAPVVVKPLDGRQGHGVSLNLSTPEQVAEAFRIAREFSPSALVEELFEGKNYRVLVVGYKVVAASERRACEVVGDGVSTVAELIERANQDPLRGDGHEKPLTKIVADDIVLACLRKSGRSLEDVPAEGEAVTLREGMNLSTGGTAKDVTDEVHPEVALACERAARAVGLDVCGVDLVVPDISQPLTSGGVIELNASPGLRMHLFPSEGERREVGEAILSTLFEEGNDGRIPVVSVTGTNGKTTVTRMIGHALAATGKTVGVTTTDGILVGGRYVARGDTTGPQSAQTVLADPSVEVAVLETARGGIVRRGLGYDWSDVAVMTNIQRDHFGQDGIESLEDVLWIKSLVAERVREGGTLVLNADDELLARLSEDKRVARVAKRIVYFSLREDHLLIKRHTQAGGTAYVRRGGWVVEMTGGSQRQRVMRVSDAPVTMGGLAEYQVANLLAAVAAGRAMGLSCETLASALGSFRADADNPGRTNLYRLASGAYALLDYGHNPEAFRAVCQMAARWTNRRVVGIVGVPGDRGDELIKEAGRIAARGFTRLVVKEDKDLRGRAPGEAAEMIRRAALEEVPGLECEIILDDTEAFTREVERAGAGDVVVMFYDKLEPLLAVLRRHGAVAVSSIEETAAAPQRRARDAAAGQQYAWR